MPRLNHISELSKLSDSEGQVDLAVGVFDGVHLGHEAVIKRVTEREGVPVVLTFEPHPVSVMRPELAPRIITPLDHKQRLIAKLGVESLLAVPFDQLRAKQSAEEFVRELVNSCDLGCVAVGIGFRFGCDRGGDIEVLSELGESLGFKVFGVDPVCDSQDEVVSSTRIREALFNCDLSLVKSLLGREHSVSGVVKEGKNLGRSMGFPTANLKLEVEPLLPFGVYAVFVELEGEKLAGVANIGVRPTVNKDDASEPILEVHLFDFDRNIYGQLIEVCFIESLRGEQKFDGVEVLKEQIKKDVKNAREILCSLS